LELSATLEKGDLIRKRKLVGEEARAGALLADGGTGVLEGVPGA
jgi:hypothetical protein